MINDKDINIMMIIHVAKHLGDLKDRVVFVGGCTTGLFITDPAMPEVRVIRRPTGQARQDCRDS